MSPMQKTAFYDPSARQQDKAVPSFRRDHPDWLASHAGP
ncbi:hypothetical protein SXCC_04489 [Gluconacetobacter sp. SXCC-1]|nr:hypothetical protein SXCC_04489 [Gluconacetobacter sp. SXCC-1]